MRRVTVLAVTALMCISTLALAATVHAAQESHLSLLEQRAAKAAKTSTGEYAKVLLDAAISSIAEAKINVAAGKDILAARQIELAEIQLNAADAKAAEKELLEKVAVRRSELKKMEARLERFRQGEEN